MFAKRRANVLICNLVLSINFLRRVRKVLLNPALRKHFSVKGKRKKQFSTTDRVNRLFDRKIAKTRQSETNFRIEKVTKLDKLKRNLGLKKLQKNLVNLVFLWFKFTNL
jgi:DNA-binding transcriptional regulator GbsR (MarR family)